jgi:hypothetical protein
MGRPTGWGGPWWETDVTAGTPSDPFLMTGFDQKALHLKHEADREVLFRVEVDFLGNGTWVEYETIPVPARGYAHHEFPQGFSAHWARLITHVDCKATAYFMYR